MSAAEIGKFIGVLFSSRDVAHIGHLKARSFSEHEALGGFYEAITPMADSYAETAQGLLLELLEIEPMEVPDGTPEQVLAEQKDWIVANRAKITANDPTLANELDTILALYYGTLYKLKFLR